MPGALVLGRGADYDPARQGAANAMREDRMKLQNMPPAAIDWPREPETVQAGETGTARQRARTLGDIQLRVVDYGAGYLADHWCGKGHILFVVSGGLVIEHQDGNCYPLSAGMSWHAGEDEGAPHRVISKDGARALIID